MGLVLKSSQSGGQQGCSCPTTLLTEPPTCGWRILCCYSYSEAESNFSPFESGLASLACLTHKMQWKGGLQEVWYLLPGLFRCMLLGSSFQNQSGMVCTVQVTQRSHSRCLEWQYLLFAADSAHYGQPWEWATLDRQLRWALRWIQPWLPSAYSQVESPNKSLPAESSQPREPQETINCCLKPLGFKTTCYAAKDNQALLFLSDAETLKQLPPGSKPWDQDLLQCEPRWNKNRI